MRLPRTALSIIVAISGWAFPRVRPPATAARSRTDRGRCRDWTGRSFREDSGAVNELRNEALKALDLLWPPADFVNQINR